MTATLTLPWPPSVNQMWRHVGAKTLLSRAGRSYRQAVALAVNLARPAFFGPEDRLAVTVGAYPPDRRRRDLDNLLKGILDSLQATGIFKDDAQIDDIHICRGEVFCGGKVVVVIQRRNLP